VFRCRCHNLPRLVLAVSFGVGLKLAVDDDTSHLLAFHIMPERTSRSPRPHTSSYTHLSAAGGGFHTNGIAKSPVVQPELNDESPKMNSLRQSLLQHIQSVQQEIARLQLERQRTQHTSAPELPDLPEDKAKKLLLPTNTSRPGVVLLQSVQWQPSIGSARSIPMQTSVPATSKPASVTVPMLGSGSLQLSSSIQAPMRGQSPSRLDGPTRTTSPSRVSAWQSPTKITMSAMPAKYKVVPRRNSFGVGPGRVSRVVQQDARTFAAVRIQRFWRRQLAKRRKENSDGSLNTSKRARVVPVHFAAARIQRKWRLYQWRRKFVDYSQRECGWVGSLEWLQHHNLLYGTELADSEDVKWWLQQRATAPLDREVDPWGSERLLEHLHRMWYGGRAEVSQGRQQQEQLQKEQLLQQQQLLQKQSRRASLDSETQRERHRTREQRSEDIFMAFAVSQDVGDQFVDNQARSSSRVVMSSGRTRNSVTTGAVSSLRAVPSAERGTIRQNSRGKDTWRAATSLSPRRSVRADRDMSGVLEQHSAEILTAFAVAVQEASGQNSSQPIMMSGRAQGLGGVASSLRAVPSAERASGSRQVSGGGRESWRVATSLSPRQESWPAHEETPSASPGADSLAARLKGAVLGGAPPPAIHGYQRSYRVASHSPPQTHRAARTTIPVTPNLMTAALPRSPVHSSAAPSSSRLSLPSSASLQSRSLGQVHRHSSSMNRALSGSPSPLVAGVGRSPLASR